MKGLQARLCVSTILALGMGAPLLAQTAPGTPAGAVPATPAGQATGVAAGATPGTPSGAVQGAAPGDASAGPSISTAAPAAAPANRVEDTGGGSDIVVTARRTEERLQDVPISITVFNQQQISNRNIVTAADLGTFTPSLSTNSRFGDDSSTFAIRGFTQETQTAPSVAVYFADVTAPRSQGGTSAGNGAGPGAFFDLQNVQVLKGPQGTLFGRNTTGGAVLLVPQKPTSEFGGYIEGTYGNYDQKREQLVVNMPFGSSVRARIGVDHMERDGWLHNRSGIGPRDFNDVNYWAFRGSLVVDLAPNLENYSIATYSDSDTHGFGFKNAYCDPTTRGANPNLAGSGALRLTLGNAACAELARGAARGDGYYDFENSSPNARTQLRQLQAINTTTWQVSDTLTLKNVASYQTFEQDQTGAIFGGNLFATAPLPNGVAAGTPLQFVSLNQHPGYDNVAQWTATEEFQVQGRTADDKLTYQGGVYYERSGPKGGSQGTYAEIIMRCADVRTLQCTDTARNIVAAGVGFPAAFLPPVGSVTESFTRYYFRNLGLYAQATYKFTDFLSVTGGFRWTSDRVRGIGEIRKITFPTPNNPAYVCADNNAVAAPTPGTCRREDVEKSSRPTWLIDVDLKPTDDILVYGKYARGYRQGGVNTSNTGFTHWGPEKVDSYEVGAKTSFHGPLRGYFNVAGFYNDFSNQQLQANAIPAVAGAPPIAPIVNGGKSSIKGVEVDASVTPFTGFTLDASYAYLKTKLKSFVAPTFDTTQYSALLPTAIVGGVLTLSPKNRVTVTGTYTLPIDSDIGRVSVGATFTHTDRQLATTGSPIGFAPATDLLNLNLNWNSIFGKPIDLALFATNVTAQHYYTYTSGSYLSAGYESVVLGQPRMYGARLRYRFSR